MISNNVLILLSYILILSNLLPFVVGTLNRKYFSATVKRFYYVNVFDFIATTFLSILSLFRIKNHGYQYAYAMLIFLAICYVLIPGIYPAIKKNVLWTLMGFLMLCVGHFYYQSDIHNFNPYVLGSEKLIICLLALFFLITLARKDDVKLLHTPEFWIVLAIFCTYSFNAIMESASNYIFIYKNTSLVAFYTVLNIVTGCIWNLFYFIGFWAGKKEYLNKKSYGI